MPTSRDQRDSAIRELKVRADGLQQRTTRPEPSGAHGAAANQAYRIIAELFGGVVVGLALGFGVDRVFDTTPWGLIGGVLVGFALSVYLARRTANRLMAQAAAEQADVQAGVADAEQADADQAEAESGPTRAGE